MAISDAIFNCLVLKPFNRVCKSETEFIYNSLDVTCTVHEITGVFVRLLTLANVQGSRQ